VICVEVGDWVIFLVPLHVDHQAVERTYPGHGMTVTDSRSLVTDPHAVNPVRLVPSGCFRVAARFRLIVLRSVC
jgi:hypothetical protein